MLCICLAVIWDHHLLAVFFTEMFNGFQSLTQQHNHKTRANCMSLDFCLGNYTPIYEDMYLSPPMPAYILRPFFQISDLNRLQDTPQNQACIGIPHLEKHKGGKQGKQLILEEKTCSLRYSLCCVLDLAASHKRLS